MALTDWSQELKFLAEREARVFQVSDPALIGDRELKRWFPVVREDLRSSAMSFLRKFTSAANTTAIAADTAQYYVDSPTADSKVFSGRWRIVDVVELRDPADPLNQGIVETLRLGFLTTLDWTEARLVEDRMLPSDAANPKGSLKRLIRVQFRNYSPDAAYSVSASLQGTTFTDPSIRSQTYFGTFYNLVSVVKLEQDGSATLEMLLGDCDFQLTSFEKLGTPKEGALTYIWKVAAVAAQEVIDAFKALNVGGSRVTCGFNEETNTVDMIFRKKDPPETSMEVEDEVYQWSCKFLVTRDMYFSLTTAEKLAVIAGITDPADGVTIEVDTSYDNEEDTWDVTITTRTRKQQNVAEYVSERQAGSEQKTEAKLGVVTETPDTELPIDDPTVPLGFEQRRKVTKNDDCSYDFERDKIEDKMQTVDETVTYRSRSRHIIHSEKLKTVEERDGVSIASELLGFDTATDGQIKRAEIRVRPSGAVDIIKDIEVKDPISTAIEYEDKADDESTRVVREDLSQPAVSGLAVDLTPNVGERMTAEVRYDPDSNTLDVTRRTETGKEMVGQAVEATPFYVESRITAQHARALGMLPSVVTSAGTRTEVQIQPEPFVGLSTVIESTRTAGAEVKTSGPAGGTVQETTELEISRNTNALNAAAGERGKNVSVSASFDELGKLAITKATSTAKKDSATGAAGGTAKRADTLQVIKNAPLEDLDISQPEAGTVVAVSAGLNEVGLLSITKETKVYSEQERTGFAGDYFHTSATTRKHEADTPDSTAAVPTHRTISVDNQPTESDLTSSVKTEVTPIARTQSEVTTELGDGQVTTTTKYWNQEIAPTIEAATGHEKSLVLKTNEYGLFDAEKTDTTVSAPDSLGTGEITWTIDCGTYWSVITTYPTDAPAYISADIQRSLKKIYKMKFFSTATDAAAYIHDGAEGSHFSSSGNWRWIAVRVDTSDTVLTQINRYHAST